MYYALAHNPFSKEGRSQLRRTIAKYGPAYTSAAIQKPLSAQSIHRKYEGWRTGIFLSSIIIGVCLLAESVLLIWGLATGGPSGGQGIIYEGDCRAAKDFTNVLAVLLNILGSVLIGTSNYTMQCLSAPSRKEVARAHANGRTLQIGSSSPSDILYMSSWKVSLW